MPMNAAGKCVCSYDIVFLLLQLSVCHLFHFSQFHTCILCMLVTFVPLLPFLIPPPPAEPLLPYGSSLPP